LGRGTSEYAFFVKTQKDHCESISLVASREANRALIQQDDALRSQEWMPLPADFQEGARPVGALKDRRQNSEDRSQKSEVGSRKNPELQTRNPKPHHYGNVGMNGPFGLEEMCRRHRKKKKIEPNAPARATRKSRIALGMLSSL